MGLFAADNSANLLSQLLMSKAFPARELNGFMQIQLGIWERQARDRLVKAHAKSIAMFG